MKMFSKKEETVYHSAFKISKEIVSDHYVETVVIMKYIVLSVFSLNIKILKKKHVLQRTVIIGKFSNFYSDWFCRSLSKEEISKIDYLKTLTTMQEKDIIVY